MRAEDIQTLCNRLNAISPEEIPYYTVVAMMEIALQLAILNKKREEAS